MEELEDITTCIICTEVYTNPKALPCIHTFCMKCIQETGIKTNKGPGDEMPCPICRRLFKIPKAGFPGLPKNFFIERLMQLSKTSDLSTVAKVLCSLCLEESKEQTGKEVPTADTYCVDCKCNLCEDCCCEHKKFKATKNHKLLSINDYKTGKNKTAHQTPIACEVHEQRVLDVYCTDCKTVVCAICFIEEHRNHEGSHVNKCVDGFRKQIQNNIAVMNGCVAQAQMKNTDLLKVKKEMQERVGSLGCDVVKRKDEMKLLTDRHACCLLEDLHAERQSRLKEIQMATDDIDAYVSYLESYKSYCQTIMAKGSSSDICLAISDLSVRAEELQQQCRPTIEREIRNFNFFFRKSVLEELLDDDCGNLVGEIEDVDSKSKKSSKQALIKERRNEIDVLRQKNDKLRQERDNYNVQLQEMKRELENNKTVMNALQKDNNKLKQTLKINNDKYCEELGMNKTREKTLETKAEKLSEKLETSKAAEFRYNPKPVFVQTIRTRVAAGIVKTIRGLTILDKELFILSDKDSEVEVYDSRRLKFSRRWKFKELIHPLDIGSCNSNKCLYILDAKDFSGLSMEILRVDPKGKLIKRWPTGVDWGYGLSVTYEANIILTVYNMHKLNEYSPDGQLIREINLSSEAGIRYPKHAVKLTNGHFVVCHVDDLLHRVCMVDAYGRLKKSFGEKSGSTIEQMNSPIHLAVDRNGFVMVADEDNHRVLLLDSDLKFPREILSKEKKHGLRYPDRILLDESSGQLFVADMESEKRRILVFNI